MAIKARHLSVRTVVIAAWLIVWQVQLFGNSSWHCPAFDFICPALVLWPGQTANGVDCRQ
jgi:hypothetical protein